VQLQAQHQHKILLPQMLQPNGAKQQEFWKVKSHDATTWALFAPISTYFSKVSSNSNQLEQLKCVFCNPIVLVIGL
jgi:hypothetical protein